MKLEPVVIEGGKFMYRDAMEVHAALSKWDRAAINYIHHTIQRQGDTFTLYNTRNRHCPPKVFSWEEFDDEIKILKLLG